MKIESNEDSIKTYKIICDVCAADSEPYFFSINNNGPILIWYRHIHYDFCSLKCLKQFVDKEMIKENKQ